MRVPQISRYTLLLILFMVPVSVMFQGSGINANYSFVLLAFVATGYRPNRDATIFVTLTTLGAVYASFVIFFGDGDAMARQMASFVLLVLPVLILYCRFPFGLREIESAVIAISVLYSIYVFLAINAGGFSMSDFMAIKNLLDVPHWPQRFVVVLLLGLFMAFGRSRERLIYFVFAFIILACIFLTFTRAAWVATAAGTLALLLPRKRDIRVPFTICCLMLIAAATNDLAFNAMSEIYERTVNGIGDFLYGRLDLDQESEATRGQIWSAIATTVAETNLFTGLGGGGIYLAAKEFGSAHNQFMDVFVRTGALGLLVYLYFWIRVLAFYFTRNTYVFAGLFAVAVFGLFHETTNSPYMAMAFFLLLNTTYIKSHINSAHQRVCGSPQPS